MISAAEYHLRYAVGDFERLQSACAKDRSVVGRLSLAEALVEQGKVDEAFSSLPPATPEEERALFLLAMAVACRQNGQAAAAAQWQARAIELLRQGNGNSVALADALSRGTPPSRAEAEEMEASPQVKAIIMAGLSQQYPQARVELASFARELNVYPVFPHHLVSRVTAAR